MDFSSTRRDSTESRRPTEADTYLDIDSFSTALPSISLGDESGAFLEDVDEAVICGDERSILRDLVVLALALCFAPPGGFLLTLAMVVKARRATAVLAPADHPSS